MLCSGTQIPLGSSVPASTTAFSLMGTGSLGSGIHITQPWFHSGLTREEAALLLGRHGTVDGYVSGVLFDLFFKDYHKKNVSTAVSRQSSFHEILFLK